MKIDKVTVLTVVTIGAVLTAGYFYMKSKKPATVKLGEGTKGTSETPTTEVATTPSVFPLQLGSKGEEVKILQQYLNRSKSCKDKMPKTSPNARVRQLLPLVEDGLFGELTETVLKLCYSSGSIDEPTFNNMKNALSKITV